MANGFYKITQSLHGQLTDKGIRVITMGDALKVDLAKQTIFPYAHIVPEGAVKSGKITSWDFRIIIMDVVDFNKNDLRDESEPFFTTDNLQDVLNDLHNRISNVLEAYTRGDEWDLHYRIVGDVSFDSFTERYKNLLAGWEVTITINTPNEDSIC